jgi:excisionase family DNA binding protein
MANGSPAADNSYLTRAEAAVRARVSVGTIDRARKEGKLKASKVAGHVLIRVDNLERWMQEGDA